MSPGVCVWCHSCLHNQSDRGVPYSRQLGKSCTFRVPQAVGEGRRWCTRELGSKRRLRPCPGSQQIETPQGEMSLGLSLYSSDITGLLCVLSGLTSGIVNFFPHRETPYFFSAHSPALLCFLTHLEAHVLTAARISHGSLPAARQSSQLQLAEPQHPPCALPPRRPHQPLLAALMVTLLAPVLSEAFSGGTFLWSFTPYTRPSRGLRGTVDKGLQGQHQAQGLPTDSGQA